MIDIGQACETVRMSNVGGNMDKHRLELFSDGVFVIVLTLLVLDLELPSHLRGIAAVYDVAPSLLVHAVTFYLIGMAWFLHHNMLSRVHHVSRRTLLLNLLALFWITLIPFAARMIAEEPMASLGIGLLVACRGLYSLSLLAMRLSAQSYIDEYPELKPLLHRLTRLSLTLAGAQLIAARSAGSLRGLAMLSCSQRSQVRSYGPSPRPSRRSLQSAGRPRRRRTPSSHSPPFPP
jgi:uncharacterized membrane protein